MRVTPLEIRKQEFKKSMRGYDAVEVDAFIEKLADDFESMMQENSDLSKRLTTADAELKHFKEVEKTLKDTLYKVQETSQLSKQNSEKEANLVKKEAELSAVQMIDKARQDVHAMREEVNTLRQQKESFIARLRHLLGSQIELLEVLEIDEKSIADIKDRTKKVFTPPQKSAGFKAAPQKSQPQEPEIKTANESAGPLETNEEKGAEFFDDLFKSDKK